MLAIFLSGFLQDCSYIFSQDFFKGFTRASFRNSFQDSFIESALDSFSDSSRVFFIKILHRYFFCFFSWVLLEILPGCCRNLSWISIIVDYFLRFLQRFPESMKNIRPNGIQSSFRISSMDSFKISTRILSKNSSRITSTDFLINSPKVSFRNPYKKSFIHNCFQRFLQRIEYSKFLQTFPQWFL